MRPQTIRVPNPEEMHRLGADWASGFEPGDVVLLNGPLGAGKTTLVRGILWGLGWQEAVRSPTFNIVQTFDTRPPVMHADLYRLQSADGLGLSEYFDDHLCFIEWPDRLGDLMPDRAWTVSLDFDGDGRLVIVDRLASH